jgi:uncharacterized protein (UPF0332 family)
VKEIEMLLEKAQRYLKSADMLIREEDFDSAASRTYYAMFYSTQAALLTKNLTFSSHKGVISAFNESFIKTSLLPRDMSRELNRAFEKRQAGDYMISRAIIEEEAADLLKNARSFIDAIKQYLQKNGHLA